MATRTVELDWNDLDKSIEVLSSAAQALQLTRFERLSYQALIVCVDLIAASVFAAFAKGIFETLSLKVPEALNLISIIGWTVGLIGGIVLLVLNIPLFRRVFRERARLKKLGLSSLSRSLWKQSQRSQWIRRIHGTLLIVAGIIMVISTLALILQSNDTAEIVGGVLTLLVSASLVFAARYLKNQRERMDLTANAEELKKAFQSLRQSAGKTDAFALIAPSQAILDLYALATVTASWMGMNNTIELSAKAQRKYLATRWPRRRLSAA